MQRSGMKESSREYSPDQVRMFLRASGFFLDVVEQDPAVTYAVDGSNSIVYCNAAWDVFASENGAPELLRPLVIGRNLLDCIPSSLEEFFQRTFRDATASATVQRFDYECSSPEQYRVFQMQIFPLIATGGFLLVNSLRVNLAHRRKSLDADNDAYVMPDGTLKMCCHCRRTRRCNSDAWDWVPSYLDQKALMVSHGLCNVCLSYFYPTVAMRVLNQPE